MNKNVYEFFIFRFEIELHVYHYQYRNIVSASNFEETSFNEEGKHCLAFNMGTRDSKWKNCTENHNFMCFPGRKNYTFNRTNRTEEGMTVLFIRFVCFVYLLVLFCFLFLLSCLPTKNAYLKRELD